MSQDVTYENSTSGAIHIDSIFEVGFFACGVRRTEKYHLSDRAPTCCACQRASMPAPAGGFVPIAELHRYVPDLRTRTIRISSR